MDLVVESTFGTVRALQLDLFVTECQRCCCTFTRYGNSHPQNNGNVQMFKKTGKVGCLAFRSGFWCIIQSLELLMEKRKFLGGSGGMLPRKILKVEIKICAIWGILEANLKKSSTLMLMLNISFVPSICIHRSIIFIFIEKNLNTFADNNC